MNIINQSKSNSCDQVVPELAISFTKTTVLIIAISCGGGLWANIQHDLECAYEANKLSHMLHWLRDSTLSMIFVSFAVFSAK